ncbi:MAG: hypothetical protein N3A38_00975 [Planctomycetota bacterium]|nr:hypothetical protein [Planctomycetota bacterium]
MCRQPWVFALPRYPRAGGKEHKMMTSQERIARILRRQTVDRIGLFEVFWRTTAEKWASEGHLEDAGRISDHFGIEIRRTGGEITPGNYRTINLVADIDRPDELIEETENARLVRDGNGALLRWHKHRPGAPEHVGFQVTDRYGWEAMIRPRLTDGSKFERRINFAAYRELRGKCLRENLFMACAVVGPFDLMAPMCGHENLLIGMAADPGWVVEMAELYAGLTVTLLEILFDREGLPDGLWVWDDLGYKQSPFMSVAMYRELIMPAHRKLFGFARSRGLPVILHCDGFVEALIPSLIEAGIDALQPIEVKAGMDPLRIKRNFGDRIALIGGMDERVLESNDPEAVDGELDSKLPGLMAGGGYILQSDHSISDRVEYGTYRRFAEKGLRDGVYR